MRSFLIFISQILFSGRRFKDSNQVVIVRKDEWLLVVYQYRLVLIITGTRGWKEWLSNFVQNGWYNSASEIAQEYSEAFGERYGPPHFVVGYSRGAAIALILAERWQCASIGFSCPRVAKRNLELRYMPLFLEPAHDLVAIMPFVYSKPVPHIMLQVPGWRHSVVKIAEIPERQIRQIERLLSWESHSNELPPDPQDRDP